MLTASGSTPTSSKLNNSRSESTFDIEPKDDGDLVARHPQRQLICGLNQDDRVPVSTAADEFLVRVLRFEDDNDNVMEDDNVVDRASDSVSSTERFHPHVAVEAYDALEAGLYHCFRDLRTDGELNTSRYYNVKGSPSNRNAHTRNRFHRHAAKSFRFASAVLIVGVPGWK